MSTRSGANRWLLLWGVCYAAMLGGVIGSLLSARQSALTELASSQSRGDWQTWREDVRQQSAQGPVARRVPTSDEPPGLVLMRDYFSICLVGAVLFTSLLYWVLVWFVTGMMRTPSQTMPDCEDASDGRRAAR